MSQSVLFEDLTTEIILSQIRSSWITDYAGMSYRSRAWFKTSNVAFVSFRIASSAVHLLKEQQASAVPQIVSVTIILKIYQSLLCINRKPVEVATRKLP